MSRRWWWATGRDLRDGFLALVPTAAAVAIAAALQPGLAFDALWTPFAVALVVAVGDALLRPLLRVLSGVTGAIAALLLGVGAQVLLVWLALTLLPGVRVSSFGSVIVTLLVVALVAAVSRWVIGVHDSSYLVADLVRRGRRRGERDGVRGAVPCGAESSSLTDRSGQPPRPGVVVVQIDGLPRPVLDLGISSGTLPTLARWVRHGSHRATGWWARVPSTTPASQAGLLHGSSDGIPAFRWYEKDTGRLMVANRPADAALVESRLSDGKGLCAGGGVSIANLFTGDAATSLLVVSRAGRSGGSGGRLGPGADYLRFFASPFVFVRAVMLTVGEMVKELYQARQQRLRGIEPRVPRGGAYIALRGITNAVLRDLNVALVAEHMMRGAPVIYVNFVDYDEIAHHAGVVRPEALDALVGIDRVLSTLERVAGAAPRDYRFVVLSDHGQSQGPTFLQVTGRTLEQTVRELVGAGEGRTLVATRDAEAWGPVNTLLAEVLPASRERRGVLVGPQRDAPRDTTAGAAREELVVTGSGNLAMVWFPRLTGRVPLEELRAFFPALVPGLLAEPAVGFVVAASARGPLAVGARGVHLLADGTVEGDDPLAPFGPRARADLARIAAMPHVGDLVVHSRLDPVAGEVHAFEELVGSHGGLGGWQNLPVLVHPADWDVDADLLDDTVPGEEPTFYGAESVHRQLVRWFERAGLRP